MQKTVMKLSVISPFMTKHITMKKHISHYIGLVINFTKIIRTPLHIIQQISNFQNPELLKFIP